MIEVRKTDIFANWFDSLKDRRAKARIQARIDRLETGHFGDVAPVGGGVSELRIFMAQAIEFISFSKVLLLSFYLGEIKAPKIQILSKQKN
jgi:putative addiction module killer protein